jgi:hypothetical protein
VNRRSGHRLRTTEKVLSTPPVLVTPKEKEPLLLYIAATHQVVSTVLVVERSEEGKLMESSDQYILSARYYLQQSKGTRTTRNLHTAYSQQQENYSNILRCTQS